MKLGECLQQSSFFSEPCFKITGYTTSLLLECGKTLVLGSGFPCWFQGTRDKTTELSSQNTVLLLKNQKGNIHKWPERTQPTPLRPPHTHRRRARWSPYQSSTFCPNAQVNHGTTSTVAAGSKSLILTVKASHPHIIAGEGHFRLPTRAWTPSLTNQTGNHEPLTPLIGYLGIKNCYQE